MDGGTVEEEVVIFRRTSAALAHVFLAEILDSFKRQNPNVANNRIIQGLNWLGFRGPIIGEYFGWAYSKGNFRVELYLDNPSTEKNKQWFDALFQQQATLQALFPEKLDWFRNDNNSSSRICLSKEGKPDDSEEKLEEYKSWAVETMAKFYEVFNKKLGEVN